MNHRSASRLAGDTAAMSHQRTLAASHRLGVFAAAVVAVEAVVFALPLGGNITPFVLVVIPAVAAVGVCGASGGRRQVRALIGRLFVWRVNARWYLAALGRARTSGAQAYFGNADLSQRAGVGPGQV
jgi:hypothetical protein